MSNFLICPKGNKSGSSSKGCEKSSRGRFRINKVEVTAVETTREDWAPICGFAAGTFSKGGLAFSIGEAAGIDGGSAVLRSPPSKNPKTTPMSALVAKDGSDRLTLRPLDHSPGDFDDMSSTKVVVSRVSV